MRWHLRVTFYSKINEGSKDPPTNTMAVTRGKSWLFSGLMQSCGFCRVVCEEGNKVVRTLPWQQRQRPNGQGSSPDKSKGAMRRDWIIMHWVHNAYIPQGTVTVGQAQIYQRICWTIALPGKHIVKLVYRLEMHKRKKLVVITRL